MTAPMPPLPDHAVAGLISDTTPYLSCDECFDRLDEYVERLAAVPQHQDLAMSTHLDACAACADEATALLELVVHESPG